MRLDGNQARAARAAVRREPIEYEVGDQVLTFRSEMPLSVLFGVEKAFVVTATSMRLWMLAHLQVGDKVCDTSCVDDDRPKLCQSLQDFKQLLRAIKVDGQSLEDADIDDIFERVRDAQGVTDPESSSSAGSSETAGDTSSKTSSGPGSRRATSSQTAPAGSAA